MGRVGCLRSAQETAIQLAVRLLDGPTAAGRLLGLSHETVRKWLIAGMPPLDRCAAIESATAGAVTCEQLRTDVEWERDAAGAVIAYRVPVPAPDRQAAA